MAADSPPIVDPLCGVDFRDTTMSQVEILARIIVDDDEEMRETLNAAHVLSEAFDAALRPVVAAIKRIRLRGDTTSYITLHDELAATPSGREAWDLFEALLQRRLPSHDTPSELVARITEAGLVRLARTETHQLVGYIANPAATVAGFTAKLGALHARLAAHGQVGESQGDFTPNAPAWPELDAAAYYGLAGSIVGLIEPHTEADPVAILMQILAYFGNAIGRHAYFPVESGQHFGNLFVALVGDTAKARKGTSEGWVESVFTSRDEQLEEWRKYHWRSGMVSGEGLIHAVRDLEEGLDETLTPPGDLRLMKDKRLLVRESEFGSILRVMGRDGNSLSGIIRQAWDGKALQTMGKRSGEIATGAHISIVGQVTWDELLRYLSATDSTNGFGNRFLWLCVRRSKSLPEGGALPDGALDAFREPLALAVRAAHHCGVLYRNDAARELWYEVYDELSAGAPGLFGAMTARGEAQVMRLALLYALLEEAREIQRPHLEAALAIWRYCQDSARYLFGDKLSDPIADTILRGLREAGDEGLTRTEVSQLFSRNVKANELARALGYLRDQSLAECDQESPKGRAKDIWRAKSALRRTKTTKTT